jgi:membrane associated rhomboid family serine protease
LAFIPIHDANPGQHIRRPWVAWGIIAVNVAVYFFVASGGDDSARAAAISFGLIPAAFTGAVERPESLAFVADSLTLITYAFVHADFWHLAGNMVFLWVFADNVEDALGHVRYFIFYLLCAALAGGAFILSDPATASPVIGASGAVAGNIGAYLVLHPRARVWVLILMRIPIRLPALYILGFWVAFQFFSAFTGYGDPQVAWWTHIGGLVAGAVLVVLMRRRGVPLFAAEPVVRSSAAAEMLKAGATTQKQNLRPDPRDRQDGRGPWG